uniref:Uncharacterized protein n=1 Tax=Helianthus annuus TaxID=4232 RepID=A0A251UIR7_HELAN
MYCSHSIVFRSTTSKASINRISFNRYRLSINLHHSVCNYLRFRSVCDEILYLLSNHLQSILIIIR